MLVQVDVVGWKTDHARCAGMAEMAGQDCYAQCSVMSSPVGALDLPVGKALPPVGVYRIEIDAALAQTWLVTPDFQRVARFKKSIRDRLPSVWMGRLLPGRTFVEATRWGRSKATWPKADI